MTEPETASSSAGAPPRRLRAEILVFLISGAVAALCNLATGAIVRASFGVRAHAFGVTAGFLVGTAVSFLLNRELTFRARRDRVSIQATKFALLAAVGIALAAVIGEVAFRAALALFGGKLDAQLLGNAAHIVAIGATTIYNFVGMKYFALRH